MSSIFAKALLPIASSIFRKTIPAGIGGIRSLFSKAPTLSAVSKGLGDVARIGGQVLDSPLVDTIASQVGGGQKGLALARQGLKGVETAKGVTDEAKNILEKVKAVQPIKNQVAPPMPPRMPVQFTEMISRGSGGYRNM